MRKMIAAILSLMMSGCASTGTIIGAPKSELPRTLGEKSSGYGYVPLDGLAIDSTLEADSCKPWREFTSSKMMFSTPSEFTGNKSGADPFKPLQESLPDLSVRFAVAAIDSSGGLSFGPLKLTSKYGNYRAVLDYINADAVPVSIWITAYYDRHPIKLSEARALGLKISGYTAAIQQRDHPPSQPHDESELITMPIYVGVGMRLTADVTALEGKVPLVSLAAIGLAAEAKRVTGTLTMQTIGITGESVAVSLPLPSKLDQTTIENSLLFIGSSRLAIYKTGSGNNTTMTPRVVGLYSPIGYEPALINAIYSELSRERPKWARPCISIK